MSWKITESKRSDHQKATNKPMQLNLFNDLYVLQEQGFIVTKTFESSDNHKFKQLENTYSISLDGITILYVQDNENGTFNTFGFCHESFNINLSQVVEIAKNKNNWTLTSLVRSESSEEN